MIEIVLAAARRTGSLELVELMEETGVCGGNPVGAGERGLEVVETVASEELLVRRSGVSGGVNGRVLPCTTGDEEKKLDGVCGVGGASWMGGSKVAVGGR